MILHMEKIVKHVVAALIFDNGKLFAAARSEKDERFGKYEFPGGKIEPGEKAEDAIIREIREELVMDIKVVAHFMHVSHEYPTFQLEMDVFICEPLNTNFALLVHHSAGFFTKEELLKLPFLGADQKVVVKIKDELVF